MFFYNVLNVVFFCIILISLTFNIFEKMYIMQLNSYRLISIIDRNNLSIKRYLFYLFLLVLNFILYIFKNIFIWYVWIEVIIVFLIGLMTGNRGCLRKIKYTKRMKRLIVLSVILLIVCLCVFVRLFSIGNLFLHLPILVSCVEFVVVLFSFIILMPFEFCIGKYYILKAKNKLKNHSRLIKIGITGSFGKTSTKEILTTILNEESCVLSTPKSYNTPFGVTKTINESLNNYHEIFVCEMGAKKNGEVKYLCDLIGVDCGIVTSVGRQHTSTFGSINEVYRTKKELPDSLGGKLCVFNLMNRYTFKMYDEYIGKRVGVFLLYVHDKIIKESFLKCRNIFVVKAYCKGLCFFEFPKLNNYYAKNIKCGKDGCFFNLYYSSRFVMNSKVNLLGIHNVVNVLLSIAMACELGVSKSNIFTGLNNLKPIKARLEKYTLKNGATVINNGYNSNIDSAKFSLSVLKYFDKQCKVVVTPGLIESEDDYKYNVLFGELIAKYCDEVVIVKEKNKKAILEGLCNACFKMSNVKCVKCIDDAVGIMNKSNGDKVYLIENDLPDNYK